MPRKNGLTHSDFGPFAEEFDRTRARPWKEASDFLDSLKENSLVLDIGAGGGRHSLYAQKRHRIIALDASREMIRIAKGKANIPCVVADAQSLPFKSGAFNAAIFVAAIHHIKTEEGRTNSLKESKRVLDNGGKLLASAWALEQEKFEKLADKKGDLSYTWDKKYPRFYHLFREGELSSIATEAGFENVREWRSGNNYWVLCLAR